MTVAALHTVRLTPADGLVPSAGLPATLFEARIHSPAGACHGLLTSCLPPDPGADQPRRAFVDEHLALDLTGPDAARWRHHADVLHLGTATPEGALEQLTEALRTHPGCAVVTADCGAGTVLVLARTGGRLAMRLRDGTSGPRSSWQRLAIGSLAHAWLAAGRGLAELTGMATSAYYSYELLDTCLSRPPRAAHRSHQSHQGRRDRRDRPGGG
ncbi:hypothetical protein [Kitasatospora sp. NPDC088351]|uniref:hypothetical protein n=1 Tax=unclassified Kitasatospora TaxID=2633591 RepID=UPI003419AE06